MKAGRDLVFVLGMGRSGTSALANIIALCGGHLPDELLAGSRGNERGHFEPVEALAINEKFLHLFGLNWFDPTLQLQADIEIADSLTNQFVAEIANFLDRYADRSPLVIKEPRIAGLTRYWFDAARRGGWAVKVVIPVRHPNEVARSLAARDGISTDFAFALWLKYTLLAEYGSRSMPRVFVGYSQLLLDWRHEIGRISRSLGLKLDRRRSKAVAAFLDGALQHHRVADAAAIENICVGAVYDCVNGACTDVPLDCERIDHLRALYFAAERMLRRTAEEQSRMAPPIVIRQQVPTVPPIIQELIQSFTELGYLAANPDVRQSVSEGRYASGLEHWLAHGYTEGRAMVPAGVPFAAAVPGN